MIDTINDGVDSRTHPPTKSAAITAMRSVMCGAHRLGIDWTYLRGLLLDARNRKLAEQIATGHGGRRVAARQLTEFLDRHWAETGAVVAASVAWDGRTVDAFIRYVQAHAPTAGDLSRRDLAVFEFALDQAVRYRNTRPVIPSRDLAVATGLTLATANRTLRSLAVKGVWLSPHRRGRSSANPAQWKASTYHLAPCLMDQFLDRDIGRGLTAPMSQPPPMYHPPMYHQHSLTEGRRMAMNVRLEATTPEVFVETVRLFSTLDCKVSEGSSADNAPPQRTLRAVDESA